MQLDLKQVNEILEYFEECSNYDLDRGRRSYSEPLKYELVDKVTVRDFEENQGYSGQIDYTFKLNEGLFVTVSCISDSYGEYSHNKIRFTVPKNKTVVQYEQI